LLFLTGATLFLTGATLFLTRTTACDARPHASGLLGQLPIRCDEAQGEQDF
jgi:hypothetical protein